MYFSFIRPLLEYGDYVWDNCSFTLSDNIEKVQIKAARIVGGAIIRTPYILMLEEFGWQTLLKRRENKWLIMMHKINLGHAPLYICKLRSHQVGI